MILNHAPLLICLALAFQVFDASEITKDSVFKAYDFMIERICKNSTNLAPEECLKHVRATVIDTNRTKVEGIGKYSIEKLTRYSIPLTEATLCHEIVCPHLCVGLSAPNITCPVRELCKAECNVKFP